MIPWFILKTLPAVADLLGIGPERLEMYGYIAGLVLISAAFGMLQRKPIHQHATLAWPVVFFIITLVLQASTLAKMETLTMVPVNIRCTFLAVTFLPIFLFPQRIRSGMTILLAQQVIIQVLSLRELGAAGDTGSMEALSEGEQVRFGGIYGSPWQYSYASIVLLSSVLLVFRHAPSKILRAGMIGLIGLTLYGMTLCVNRANIPCVVLLFVGWWADQLAARHGRHDPQRLVRIFKLAAVAAAVLVAGAAIVFFVLGDVRDSLLDFWAYRFATAEGSDGMRFDSWKVGVKLFLNNSLIGVGWDRVAIVGPAYGLIMTVHNSFIQAAAEGGIFGFCYATTLLLVIPIYLIRRAWRFEGRYLVLAGYGCLLLFNMLASNLHYENHWDLLMFWALWLEWRANAADKALAKNRKTAPARLPNSPATVAGPLPLPAPSPLSARGPA